MLDVSINACPVEMFVSFLIYLKLKLLMQFPASNDEKYV